MSSMIGLTCAVLAALAFGVLSGYGACAAFFRIIGHRPAPSAAPAETVLAAKRVAAAQG